MCGVTAWYLVAQAKTFHVSPSTELLWIQQGQEADKMSIQIWVLGIISVSHYSDIVLRIY